MALSAIFIALCALVYAGLSVLLGLRRGRSGGFSDRRRRWVEGVSGGMVAIAALVLARD